MVSWMSRVFLSTGEFTVTRNYSVLLAEPNPMLREKMAGILTRSSTFWCVIQVQGRGNLARAAAQAQPDFVVADLLLIKDPELIEFLRQTSVDSRIVALVDAKLGFYKKAIRELGVDGVIERGRAVEDLNAMIVAEGAGETRG